MATKAYKEIDLTLQDNKEVNVRPLPIGRLRRFMDAWGKAESLEDGDPGYEVLVNCCGIALEHNFKGQFDALKASGEDQKNGEFLSGEYKEYLEDVLDTHTIYLVIEVAGGIRLNDPKLVEAILEAQEADGKTSTS